MPGPRPWEYESAADRANRLRQQSQQTSNFQSWSDRVDSFLGPTADVSAPDVGNGLSDLGTARRLAFQQYDRATDVGSRMPAPDTGGGGGGFLGGLRDVGAGFLHQTLRPINYGLGKVATVGQGLYAPLTGETRAGRHEILDAQGNPTGQFYRDAPDFGDVGAALAGFVKHPIREMQAGPEAFRERLQNPEMTAVSRGVLGAGSNPLTYLFGPAGAAANVGASVGLEALNENADKIPGYRNLSPDVQQALQLTAPLLAGKLGEPVLKGISESRPAETVREGLQGRGPLQSLHQMGGSIVAEHNPAIEQYMDTLAEHNIEMRFDRNGDLHVVNRRDALAKADALVQDALSHIEGTRIEGGSGGQFAFHFGSPEYEAHQLAQRQAAWEGRGVQRGATGEHTLPDGTNPADWKALDDAERIQEVVKFGRVDPINEINRRPFAEGSRLADYEPSPEYQTPLLEEAAANRRRGFAKAADAANRVLGQDDALKFVEPFLTPEMNPRGVAGAIESEIKARGFTIGRKKLSVRERAYRERLDEIANTLLEQGHEAVTQEPRIPAVSPSEALLRTSVTGEPGVGTVAEAAAAGQGAPGTVRVYHGTAGPLEGGNLRPDAFVTTDPKVAETFAKAEARRTGGEPKVYAFDAQPGALKATSEATPGGESFTMGNRTFTVGERVRGVYGKQGTVTGRDGQWVTVEYDRPFEDGQTAKRNMPNSLVQLGREPDFASTYGGAQLVADPAGLTPVNQGAAAPFSLTNIPLVRHQATPGEATFSADRGGTWYTADVGPRAGMDTGYGNVPAGKGYGGANRVTETYTPRNPLVLTDADSSGAGPAAVRKLGGEQLYQQVFDALDSANIRHELFARVGISAAEADRLAARTDGLAVMLDRLGTEMARQAGYDSIIHSTPNGAYTEVVKLGRPGEGAAGAPPSAPGGGAPPPIPPSAGTPSPAGGGGTAPGRTFDPYNLGKLAPQPLGRADQWMNALKRTLGIGIEEDSRSTPVMRYRRTAEPKVASHADTMAAVTPVIVDNAFMRDVDGRIIDLPGKPTIQDVAARLPDFLPVMTQKQIAAMRMLEAWFKPYGDAMQRYGIDHGQRPDIAEGGFYLPRGNAELEGADAPMAVRGAGRGTSGGKISAEKHAKFVPGGNELGIESMADAIEAGYQYTPLEEALRGYVRNAGRRVIDKQVADYFANLKDEEGNYVGETPMDRVNPAVKAEYQNAKQDAVRIARRLNTATGRAGIAGIKGDTVAALLERQATGAAQRASAGAESAAEVADRMSAMRQRITPAPRTAEAATNEIKTLNNFIGRAQDRIAALRQRGAEHSVAANMLQDQLDTAKARLDAVTPLYQTAIDNSRNIPREQGRIALAGLEQYTFPDMMANAANKYLVAEKPATGARTQVLRATDAFNSLLRGLRASSDVSFMGIQGLLGAVHDPIGYGKALGAAWKAAGDPQALGKYILDFDRKALANNRPTIREWIENGALHIGGADTEFAMGQGLPKALSAISKGGKFNPVRGSNRMFGYFGDVMRAELADTAFENAAAHGFDMAQPSNMRAVGEAANLATGWSPNTFAGDVGGLVAFAPRFFQSQLELIGNALTDKTLSGELARRQLMKLMGAGTLLTVAANEASPNGLSPEDYLIPFRKDGSMNPNFMRIRVGNQDVSLFGPWDSLLRGVSNMAKGDVTYLARTKASPAVSLAWDLITGKTFTGAESRTPGELMRNLLPFSLQNAPEAGAAALQGDFSKLANEAIGTTGLKATPMTANEELDSLSQALHGKPFNELLASQQQEIKDSHPDLWQRAVERKSAASQRFELMKQDMRTQQSTADDAFLNGTLTREEWKDQMDNRRQQMFGVSKALFDNKPIGTPRNAEERYIKIIESHQDPTGKVDWDKVDADVANLSPEDQAYIEDRQGLGNTRLTTLYKQAAKQRSEMFSIPKYNGFTADEARKIDELWVAARTNSRKADPGQMLRALRQLVEDGKVEADPRILAGVRKRIVGNIRTSKARERYAKSHPLMTAFYGGAGKAGALSDAEASLLQG